MKPYNKNNLINLSIGALILLTIGSVIAAFTVAGAKYAFLLILPTLAAGYGCYAFYKKYHISDIYNGDKKPEEPVEAKEEEEK